MGFEQVSIGHDMGQCDRSYRSCDGSIADGAESQPCFGEKGPTSFKKGPKAVKQYDDVA